MADNETSAIEHFNTAAVHYEKYTGGCTRQLVRLLLDLPELADAGAPESVTEGTVPGIHVVDPAVNMVNIARGKLDAFNGEHRYKISSNVMPGERLNFDENTFTHSITNLGILFFSDGLAGAKKIHRTLRPGCVAAVTSWSDLGYFEPIIKLEIRPGESPHQLPISPDWLSPASLESILGQCGFRDVKVSAMKVHFAAATLEELVDLLADAFQVIWKDWLDDEKARFRGVVHEKTSRIAEEYTMVDGEKGQFWPAYEHR
ncbi:uncharacterized protein B0T15DRAFT_559201 [Chaetomium strumarium]|uniref:Methyltransferase type 11 domain-containing protein n=1 Tax=Chaetomium strumarium TaxID=1170767 RepID=A0AAJ0GMQ8_9PEZI|nr:hypothetical protein B0T15DRAFT_559201 [Chaetomium strumarium]